MELDRICQNCSSFVQDSKDLYADLGVCVNDDVFEPFLDEIMENADFSNCYEMYLKKRFDGGSFTPDGELITGNIPKKQQKLITA